MNPRPRTTNSSPEEHDVCSEVVPDQEGNEVQVCQQNVAPGNQGDVREEEREDEEVDGP